MDFIEKIRLRGQAEEDMFFAELDRQLIEAMHERRKHEEELLGTGQNNDSDPASSPLAYQNGRMHTYNPK